MQQLRLASVKLQSVSWLTVVIATAVVPACLLDANAFAANNKATVTATSNTSQAKKLAPADTVLLNGKIITLDSNHRIVEALAIVDGRIQATGSIADIKKHVGQQTKVIDLKGKTVVPGLIETHCHAVGVARGAILEPFVELSTITEVQAWIREKMKQVPAGRWIRVPRTDITRLKERRHPTPAEFDAVCTTHPIIFNAARKNVLNSLGFKTVGITRGTESIPGGKIIRDKQGNPLMIAGGDGHLRKFIPRREFSDEETLAGLKKVHQRYNEVGITSIFERAVNRDQYRFYETLRDKKELTVRTTATFRQQFSSGQSVEKFSKQLGLKTGDGNDWLRVGPLKITVDGGIHWGSTHLREAYGPKRIKFYVRDDPNYRGDLRYSVNLMTKIFEAGHRAGWQICCHVTGDAGVDRVLDALEAVNKKLPISDRRFTLTHAYFPALDSIKRAKRLGVCVDTQSYLYYKDADAMAEVYGQSWAERFIGIGDWVRGGIPTAINSDHMIGMDPDHAMNSFNPFLMLYIAVTRKNDAGRVYGPWQKLSRTDALRCVTSMAAYLSFDEDTKGSLEPGRFADLAVLDRDYLTCPEDDIRHIKVLRTMVDGKFVYQR